MRQKREKRADARGAERLSGYFGTGRRAGFTMMELLQVMVITGIVMSIAASRIDWMSRHVTSSARQVSTTLLAAQRLALLRQHAVVVAVDTANRRIRIHEDRNNNGVIDAGERSRYLQLEDAVSFGRGSAPAAPQYIGSTAVSFKKKQDGMPAVTFYRGGSASEFGGFYLTSRRSLSSNRYVRDAVAIEINRSTGRTSYLAYDGAGWSRRF